MELAWPSCLERPGPWVFQGRVHDSWCTWCAFHFLRDGGTPSGGEACKLLYVSLHVPMEVEEA